MGEAVNYIALSIPVFFLLIGIEYLISKLKQTNLYRFNDAITNLSCGIGQQVLGVFLKTVIVLLYVFVYDNYRFFTIPGGLLTGIALFIGIDFFYYWFHRLAHEISVLWGSHVVHHQSEEYNLTVALRQGWVQSVFSVFFYLPLAFLGFNPILFLSINAFQTLYQFWIHTRTIGKLPKPIEYIFNTPSHHRVHHGLNPKYIDRNHGGTLIIFDRIFGTFQEEEEEVVYGVTQQPNSWNPLWLNIEYWAWMWGVFVKAQTWTDRWKVLFNEPGWQPAYLGGASHPKLVTPQTFHKYDTYIPMSLNYYVMVHYLVILAGTTFFLFSADTMDTLAKTAITGLVIFSLITIGAIFEKRRWVWVAELLRLLLVAGIIGFVLHLPLIWVAAVCLFCATSVGWILPYKSLFQF